MNAPILSMLINHRNTEPISFHVPGHKRAKDWPATEGSGLNEDMLRTLERYVDLDVTELSSTDDLHDPSGAILEAQQLAAACFGAEETCLLVGGSTSGNMAMILGTCSPGDLIIVQRNVHKSVLNGLILAGAKVVFLHPYIEEGSGLAIMPPLLAVQEALDLYPEAKAVFLTNPNYYGLCMPLDAYSHIVHEAGAVLLVDEAHGAHFGQHPRFPGSALQGGADGVVQSTHKTLSAMTMGAMLHMQGSRIDRSAVKQALTMLQSSSPSFPILASIDAARAQLSRYGSDWFDAWFRGSRQHP